MIELFDVSGTSVPVFDATGKMVFGPPQGSGPATPEVDNLPPLLSDTHALLRPSGRVVFSATIANDGTGDFGTTSAAFDAAKAAVAAKKKAESWTIPDFHYQCQFFVKEGTYEQAISGAPVHSQIYGEGIDKTVFIGPSSGAPRGVLEVGTGWLHMEGIAVKRTRINPDGSNPVYPVHASNTGVTTYVDCRFSNDIGGFTYGMDGNSYGQTTFYACSFGAGSLNLHGWAGQTTPETICFIEHKGGDVGYDAMDAGNPSEVWVSGVVGNIVVKGAATTTHIAPGTEHGTLSIAGAQDQRADWPVPVGGLTPHWREKLGV